MNDKMNENALRRLADRSTQPGGLNPKMGAENRAVIAVRGGTEREMRRIGDGLQSEASRLAEWVAQCQDVPYEVHMAMLGVDSYVKQWTQLRRGEAKRE